MFYNNKVSKIFKRNNCPEDMGSEVAFMVPVALFCSDVSQEDADRKAIQYMDSEGQAFANKNGGCCKVYYSRKIEGDFFCSVCPEGQAQSDPTHFIVEAGTFFSLDDQDDADWKAEKYLAKEGQKLADTTGVCKTIYFNKEQHGWFSKKCENGWIGPEKYRKILAGTLFSFESEEDANAKAKELLMKEGQEWVDYNTKCEPIDPCLR